MIIQQYEYYFVKRILQNLENNYNKTGLLVLIVVRKKTMFNRDIICYVFL